MSPGAGRGPGAGVRARWTAGASADDDSVRGDALTGAEAATGFRGTGSAPRTPRTPRPCPVDVRAPSAGRPPGPSIRPGPGTGPLPPGTERCTSCLLPSRGSGTEPPSMGAPVAARPSVRTARVRCAGATGLLMPGSAPMPVAPPPSERARGRAGAGALLAGVRCTAGRGACGVVGVADGVLALGARPGAESVTGLSTVGSLPARVRVGASSFTAGARCTAGPRLSGVVAGTGAGDGAPIWGVRLEAESVTGLSTVCAPPVLAVAAVSFMAGVRCTAGWGVCGVADGVPALGVRLEAGLVPGLSTVCSRPVVVGAVSFTVGVRCTAGWGVSGVVGVPGAVDGVLALGVRLEAESVPRLTTVCSRPVLVRVAGVRCTAGRGACGVAGGPEAGDGAPPPGVWPDAESVPGPTTVRPPPEASAASAAFTAVGRAPASASVPAPVPVRSDPAGEPDRPGPAVRPPPSGVERCTGVVASAPGVGTDGRGAAGTRPPPSRPPPPRASRASRGGAEPPERVDRPGSPTVARRPVVTSSPPGPDGLSAVDAADRRCTASTGPGPGPVPVPTASAALVPRTVPDCGVPDSGASGRSGTTRGRSGPPAAGPPGTARGESGARGASGVRGPSRPPGASDPPPPRRATGSR
ncbi:Hypothetical protein SCLAV_p1195 (plasmid) [Streptomyces clavuligerus]|uniref:Uncharacterized protein n=1 Tax=Streptomyces clavuligerus TaxID=1901 RepID=D5SL88_STRCL|nr:Hypothetical protein SCLAV_p1195 [Streptomyces clavuligerus]